MWIFWIRRPRRVGKHPTARCKPSKPVSLHEGLGKATPLCGGVVYSRMNGSSGYLDYLSDIDVMFAKVETFTAAIEFDAFVADDKTYMAVVRGLEVIGEAAKQIPPSLRKRYPQLPWKRMAGMRDKLIHAYFGTDAKIVWETATDLVPTLRPLIKQVIEAESQETQ